jgi:CelD/BcsL family acetyltransferase involved in cellulose biosynthesis
VLYDQSIAIQSPPLVTRQTPLEVKVSVVDDVAPEEWAELLSQDPRSTFFHTVEWGKCLENALPGWERFYIVGKQGRRLAAGLPVMRYTKRRVSALLSMPFGTYGGPLVGSTANLAAGGLLAERFFAEARGGSVAYAEMVDLPSQIQPMAAPGIRQIEDETRVLNLSRGFDKIHRGFKPANRNKIRKAQKSGVVVRRGRRRDDYLRYHTLLLDCSKNWGGRVRFDRRFFEVLAAIEGGSVQLWLAEHQGDVIAGLLNFMHGNNVMNWGAVMLRNARSLSPMNLLHAEAIRDAVNRGMTIYNFGSSAGFKGVDQFKMTFGTSRVQYRHHVLQKRWFSILKRWSRRRRT